MFLISIWFIIHIFFFLPHYHLYLHGYLSFSYFTKKEKIIIKIVIHSKQEEQQNFFLWLNGRKSLMKSKPFLIFFFGKWNGLWIETRKKLLNTYHHHHHYDYTVANEYDPEKDVIFVLIENNVDLWPESKFQLLIW